LNLTKDGELAEHRDFASYGAMMDASLASKLADIAPWVKPGFIVDKGCGTGALLSALAHRFPKSDLVGVDLSAEMLRRCEALGVPRCRFTRGDAALTSVEPGCATTVVFSSILHEVYTYNGYSEAHVHTALASAFADLGPGGRLIVRDGLRPAPATWRMRFLDAQTREVFLRFSHEFRRGRGCAFEWVDAGTVQLASADANEFLCKKDYLHSWHIEVHEAFGVWRVDEWAAALRRHGFDAIEIRPVTNPWIVDNRYAGRVALFSESGDPLPWPATNVVVVGEKRG
jgi:SAM-dependent methyltransferase